MKRIHTIEVSKHVGKQIKIAGFAQNIRKQGGIIFILVRDVTGIIQVVVTKHAGNTLALAKDLSQESVIEVTGIAKKEKQAPGGYEISAETIQILSHANPDLPIPVIAEKGADKTHQPTRLDWRWIDLRKPNKLQIFKTWTVLEKGFREYFNNAGYIQIYSPSFMDSPSESGADVFEIEYFGKKAYLSQSPQFYKQMAMASGFEKIFTFGPVFRAEESFTRRHLTEFTGWDFEISYIQSHQDVMNELERLIVNGFKKVKDALQSDLKIPSQPFPKISMIEAKKKLKAAGINGEKEHDINPKEERGISKIIQEETGHDFVFITDYHIGVRPFYHMRHEDNPDLTKSFDLLYKGVEITTGAQREHRTDILIKQIKEKGMDPDSFKNYVNFFRYGCPPHGGAGLGPARIIMQMLDLANIREATFLPRDVKRLTP